MEAFLKIINDFPKPKAAKIVKIMMDHGAKIAGNVAW